MASLIDTGRKDLSYFPKEMIMLQREITYHPELRKQLDGVMELHEWYAIVATYAEVVVDGAFGPRELKKLTEFLYDKLRTKRGKLIMVR